MSVNQSIVHHVKFDVIVTVYHFECDIFVAQDIEQCNFDHNFIITQHNSLK